jgi:LmbE family N-acetylglucosaminyl deacetylase
MNILVIAPHPDDESIGCGGTICLHTGKGDHVVSVFLTSGELGLKDLPRDKAWAKREREAKRAAKILGIAESIFLRLPDWFVGDHIQKAAEKLRPILESESPGLIYFPHAHEWHPDHKAALPIVRAALAEIKIAPPKLRSYEVWTPLSEYDEVENITGVMAQKLKAVRCHRSQIADIPYDRAIRGLNQYRGELAGNCRFAEVFQTIDLMSDNSDE